MSWKGISCFNGGVCFSDGGLIFKWEDAPWGGIGFGGGGGEFEKSHKIGGCPHAPPPLWETLVTTMELIYDLK